MTDEDRQWIKQFQSELKEMGLAIKGSVVMRPDYFDISWRPIRYVKPNEAQATLPASQVP